jgi:hypothetical protein
LHVGDRYHRHVAVVGGRLGKKQQRMDSG